MCSWLFFCFVLNVFLSVLNLFLDCTCTVLFLLLLCSAPCWSMATCIHLQWAYQPVYIVTFPSVAWIACITWVVQHVEPLDVSGAGKLMLVSLHWWWSHHITVPSCVGINYVSRIISLHCTSFYMVFISTVSLWWIVLEQWEESETAIW